MKSALFTERVILLVSRDQDPPRFRSLNPQDRVPTLVIDGCALIEVAAILSGLARAYPEAERFPASDSEAQA